uniref:Uncharacterized protein n=1 Tax=Opuntia streptacantha TaxID=393608 RepID=A0A7C9ETC0_OPUST
MIIPPERSILEIFPAAANLTPPVLRHRHHKLPASVRRPSELRPGGGGEAEPPQVNLKVINQWLRSTPSSPNHNLGNPRVNFHNVGTNFAGDINTVGDESEAIGAVFNGDVNVGIEGKF